MESVDNDANPESPQSDSRRDPDGMIRADGVAGPEQTPAQVASPQIFRVNPLAYFTVLVVFLVTLFMAGAATFWLWTLLIPFALAWWIARIRTVATAEGLRAVNTFSTRELTWEEIEGIQFPKWTPVRAVLADGSKVNLPAISFRDLPRLSAVSGGRIPDPYAGLDV